DTALQPPEPTPPMALAPPARPPALAGVSAGAWEQKPVAVLAIELTWPDHTASEALGDEPWTVTTVWQHSIVEKKQGFGGSSCSAPRRGSWSLLACRRRGSSCRSGRCRRRWRSGSSSRHPPTLDPVLRCGWWALGAAARGRTGARPASTLPRAGRDAGGAGAPAGADRPRGDCGSSVARRARRGVVRAGSARGASGGTAPAADPGVHRGRPQAPGDSAGGAPAPAPESLCGSEPRTGDAAGAHGPGGEGVGAGRGP